jgi:endoglucanase
VVPQASFEVLADPKTYMAKAFDDRVGTALMIQCLERLQDEKIPNRLAGVATVMEEVGIRGAKTSAELVSPDVAIVLESDIAGDVPGISEEQSSVKLGLGPTVLLYDRRMIPNLKLRDFVLETAEAENIPIQISLIEGGGTDGGAIHLHKIGVPTVVIGVPVRHIHSHSGILHRDDYDRALELLVHLVKRLSAKQVKSFIP